MEADGELRELRSTVLCCALFMFFFGQWIMQKEKEKGKRKRKSSG
jgi:hypothetical protein